MEKQQFSIKVSGMTCEHCVNTVKNLVEDERGIEFVKITLATGELIVSGNQKMNRAQIVNAINLSGIYNAE